MELVMFTRVTLRTKHEHIDTEAYNGLQLMRCTCAKSTYFYSP